jgi:hypothetical protein
MLTKIYTLRNIADNIYRQKVIYKTFFFSAALLRAALQEIAEREETPREIPKMTKIYKTSREKQGNARKR